jgi:glycine oxidase
MSAATDVAVVGGGIVGAAIVWELAQAGRDVIWVVPDSAHRSASAASGAMLSIFSEVSAHQLPETVAMEVDARAHGRALWSDWLPELTKTSGISVDCNIGTFVIGANRDDLESLGAIEKAAAARGAGATSVDPDDIPGFRPERGAEAVAALHLSDEASLDSSALITAMYRANKATPHVSIVQDDARRIAVTTAGADLHLLSGACVSAGEVVLAVGVGTTPLLANSGLADLVAPVFGGRGVGSLVRSPSPAPVCIRTPNRTFACGLHLVPRADGATYLGATNRLTTLNELADGPRLDELDELINGCVRELDSRLRRAELLARVVGYRPVTVDRLPLAGRTATQPILVATGTWRNGVVLAPTIATLIRQEIEHPGSMASHAFSPQRRVVAEALDDASVRRAAKGIMESLVGGARLAPGRSDELLTLLRRVVELEVDVERRTGGRSVARLLERAPMEEALPLVIELLTRGR